MSKTDSRITVWYSEAEILKQWEISQRRIYLLYEIYLCGLTRKKYWPQLTKKWKMQINYVVFITNMNITWSEKIVDPPYLNSSDQQFACINQNPWYHTLPAYGEIFTWIKVPYGHFRSAILRHNQEACGLIWLHVSNFFSKWRTIRTVHLKYWGPRLPFPLRN